MHLQTAPVLMQLSVRWFACAQVSASASAVPGTHGCADAQGAGLLAGVCTYDPMRARVLQLKQMKELDQEQEVLLQGLEMIVRGREWYQQQLQRVQERQRRLSQSRAAAVSPGTPRQ